MSNGSPDRSGPDLVRRKARLGREAVLLEEGRADIRARRCLTGDALDAWLEDLDSGSARPRRANL
jgi:hypothetical protein